MIVQGIDETTGQKTMAPANGSILSRLTGSDVTTTGQSLATITGLSQALAANAVYEFETVLFCAVTAVTTGNKYGVNFDQSGSTIIAGLQGALTTAADKSELITALNTASGAYLTTSAQTGKVSIRGIITTGANAGNLIIQHLKVTSGTSTVKIGSFLKTTRIA
jgi:hypothetical protein